MGAELTAVVVPGDPEALLAAASKYTKTGFAMHEVASRLLSALGDVSSWQGVGAEAHAARVRALSGAHRVAGEAILAGSQALSTYAHELSEAQALARRANHTGLLAADTARELYAVSGREATASSMPSDAYFSARFGDFGPGESPEQRDAARATQLRSVLDEQSREAATLGHRATVLAAAAGEKAARAFAAVAQLAGRPGDRGSRVVLASYLGAAGVASAEGMVFDAGKALAGGSGAERDAVEAFEDGQGPASEAQEEEIARLEGSIWQSTPEGFSAWPAELRLSWLQEIAKNEQQLADAQQDILGAMAMGSVETETGGDGGDDGGDGDDGGGEVEKGGFAGAEAAILNGDDDIPPALDPGDGSVHLAPNGGLAGNEGAQGIGGHALAKHVDVDLDYLNDRLDQDPGMKVASMYTNRATAEAATAGAVADNRAAIDNWLSGSKGKLILRPWTASEDVGVGVVQSSRNVIGLKNVQVVLIRSSNYPSGYYVLTSYPKP